MFAPAPRRGPDLPLAQRSAVRRAVPAPSVERARRLGHAVGQSWMPGPRDVVRRLTFGRFQSWSRLTNWFYNETEQRLLTLETQARESLKGIQEWLSEQTNPGRAKDRFKSLASEFLAVSGKTLAADDYGDAEKELTRIADAAEALSTSIARYDIPLGESFNVGQETALESYALGAESSLSDVIAEVQRLAGRGDLGDLPAVRELLDVLGQWVSDAMIKVPKLRPQAVPLKAAVLAAGAEVQKAYLLAFVRRDHRAASGAYLKALLILKGGVDPDVVGALAKASLGLAKPKLREASTKPYDTASMMLARAFVEDGFVPDLVVGLPTGGVHAATRVVAALSILTGTTPTLWATRPQGVKEESQKFMKGTGEQDILSTEEVEWLREKRIRSVAIVDDGFQSGGTLVLSRKIYQQALKADVRTGVIEASIRQMGSEVDVGEEEPKLVPNPADYVAVAGVGAAGPTGVLAKVFDDRDVKSTTDPSLKGTAGIINTEEAVKLIKVGDLLDL